MKKTALIALLSLLAINDLASQASSSHGTNHAVSLGLNIPVGVFSETHIAGLSLGYLWSQQRFGKLNKVPAKWPGFTANGGIAYYLGKKETVAGYDFKYGGYTYFHLFGGIIYNPCKDGNIRLTTGPTMGLYKGSGDIGFGVDLSGSYYITDKIAISPGVMYMKHDQTEALWIVMIKTVYNF